MFTRASTVSAGWTWRQPMKAGSTVRTSTGAEVQPRHPPTGEAADIRHRRGGQWRASMPDARPRQRGDRAGRHKNPPHYGRGDAHMSTETAAQRVESRSEITREDVNSPACLGAVLQLQ